MPVISHQMKIRYLLDDNLSPRLKVALIRIQPQNGLFVLEMTARRRSVLKIPASFWP